MKLFLLAYLLRCQCDHLLWSNPLRQATVWLRDAGAGAPHLHLQPHHHPRPLKVRSQEVLWTMKRKSKYKSSLHGKALSHFFHKVNPRRKIPPFLFIEVCLHLSCTDLKVARSALFQLSIYFVRQTEPKICSLS